MCIAEVAHGDENNIVGEEELHRSDSECKDLGDIANGGFIHYVSFVSAPVIPDTARSLPYRVDDLKKQTSQQDQHDEYRLSIRWTAKPV